MKKKKQKELITEIMNGDAKDNLYELYKSTREIKLEQPEVYDNPMWMFQFDDDEPQVLAVSTGSKELTLKISNHEWSNIHFYGKDGKVFKIFAKQNEDDSGRLHD